MRDTEDVGFFGLLSQFTIRYITYHTEITIPPGWTLYLTISDTIWCYNLHFPKERMRTLRFASERESEVA